jgi:hypothetical protein
MSSSSTFDWLCDAVENASGFSRLEARGTVRIALKEVGLLPADLTPLQAAKVAEHVLPGALASRGVDDATAICQNLTVKAKTLEDEREGPAPDEVFQGLGK